MENSKSRLTTAGISLLVSTAVVLVNNFFMYRHACKKTKPCVCVCTSDNTVKSVDLTV
jgi:hypothetical protein